MTTVARDWIGEKNMRLIDADTLTDYIKVWNVGEGIGDNHSEILKAVDRQPTIEAIPVVHGERERTNITTEDGWALYRCTCCDWHTTYYYSFSASPTYNFCPNCGAKMN